MRHFVFVSLLIAVPALSFAQKAPYDLVGSAGVVHIEEMEINGHHQTHFSVMSNSGTADLTFDGRTIRYGDGYSIVLTILANTPNAFVARFTANGPGATSATAILAKNLHTGDVTYAGLEEISGFLRRSHDAQIAGVVMRSLADLPAASLASGNDASISSAGAHSGRLVFKPAPADCATSAVLLILSAAGVFTCPEGGLTCLGGAVGVITQTYTLATSGCGTDVDNTIGWG
jgi:hypothetical protein